jgi:hypothetical protein
MENPLSFGKKKVEQRKPVFAQGRRNPDKPMGVLKRRPCSALMRGMQKNRKKGR